MKVKKLMGGKEQKVNIDKLMTINTAIRLRIDKEYIEMVDRFCCIGCQDLGCHDGSRSEQIQNFHLRHKYGNLTRVKCDHILNTLCRDLALLRSPAYLKS